jgi:hypothetical protein
LALRTWNKVKLAQPSMGGGIQFTGLRRFGLRPMLVDAYVLNGFVFYFVMLVTSLVLLVEVFTFFELLGDMIKNNIPLATMLDYLWHLAPQLIYTIAPLGTLPGHPRRGPDLFRHPDQVQRSDRL